METQLRLSVGDGDHADDLLRWLGEDPDLRRGTTPIHRPPGPGEMGSLVDVIAVAVAGGGTLSVLASSLKTWLAHPRRSDVEVEIHHPDGRVVKVNAKNVTDVDAVLRRLVGSDGTE